MKLDTAFSDSGKTIPVIFSEMGKSLPSAFGNVQTIHNGQNGATFTPSVSEDGVISWENDRGLENPSPVNIKGPKGDPGKDGAPGADGRTPQKGVDYFTENDKQEMVDEVLSADVIVQMQTDIDKILAELSYEKIAITGFSCPGAGTYEIGRSVAAPTITWSLSKAPVKQTLNGVSLGVDVRSKAYTGNITGNTSYKLIVTDEKGGTATASGSYTFLRGVYYGVMTDGATIDSAAILNLMKELRGDRKITFTANAEVGQRHAFAIPSVYGDPTFKDAETGFQASFYLASTVQFTNASGHTEEYNVWLSTNSGMGSMTVTVS